MAAITTEILRPRESRNSLKQATGIDEGCKEPLRIAENVPRLLSLQTFIKELSRAKRGFGLNRQNKVAKSQNPAPKIKSPEVTVNSTQHVEPLPKDHHVRTPPALDPIGQEHDRVQTSEDQSRPLVTPSIPANTVTPRGSSPSHRGSQQPDLSSVAEDSASKGKATEHHSENDPVSKAQSHSCLGSLSDDGPTGITEPSKATGLLIEEPSASIGMMTGISEKHDKEKTKQGEQIGRAVGSRLGIDEREMRKSSLEDLDRRVHDMTIQIQTLQRSSSNPQLVGQSLEELKARYEMLQRTYQEIVFSVAEYESQEQQLEVLSQPPSFGPDVQSKVIYDAAGELPSTLATPILPMQAASPVDTRSHTFSVRTISILSRPRGVPIFGKMSDDLYEARCLRPDEETIRQWTTSWKPTITKRLRDMHLGSHAVMNLRICMMGRIPHESGMKPTILLVCADSKRKEVETGLANFIKVSVPTGVDFRVVSSIIKPASGISTQLEKDKSNLGARMRFTAPEDLISLVGTQMRVQTRDRRALYPICTIGGIINVGDTLYALSVGHSMFGQASEVEDPYSTLDWVSYGKVGSYEWTGNENTHVSRSRGDSLLFDPYGESISMDWMLIRLGSEFMLPNTFRDPNESINYDVSGFWERGDLEYGDVIVCGGVSGTQYGLLDPTATSILYGENLYEVSCLALEHPLVDGDSGSWVIKDNRLCGYIFARIEDKPWGYMFPIEPVFHKISKALSPSDCNISVDVPGKSTISFLRSLAPMHSSAASSLEFDLTPAPSHTINVVPCEDATLENPRPESMRLPAAPTRDAPLPPPLHEINAADISTIITMNTHVPLGRLSPATEASVGSEGTNVPRNRNPLQQFQQWYWNQGWLSRLKDWLTFILTGLAFLALLLLSLSPLAGAGYLIYYIAKRTALPVYAKVLASIAAASIFPAILAVYTCFARHRKVEPTVIQDVPAPPQKPEINTHNPYVPVELFPFDVYEHPSELSSTPLYELPSPRIQEMEMTYSPHRTRVHIGSELV